MRKIISMVMVLLPCTAIAATECRVAEYPDHYVAECIGDAAPTPTSMAAQRQIPGMGQLPGLGQMQEQTALSAMTPEMESPDLPPEQIVRNDLARLHGAVWLKRH